MPTSVRLRAYQVGFGDCLLLTVGYSGDQTGDQTGDLPDGRTERHILVDFGAKVLARGGPKLAQLAVKLAEHCDGHLDVVVATHRHQDHVRGFGDEKAKEHLRTLEPSLIVRPWTDRPADARDEGVSGLDPESRKFLALLDLVGGHHEAVVGQFGFDTTLIAKRVAALAELGVSNVQALAMLDSWKQPDPTVWVRADDHLDVEEILPGVSIRVLGPPTLDQVPRLKSYASSSAEYWLGMTETDQIAPELTDTEMDDVLAAKEIVAPPGGLGTAAWLVEKMHRAGPRQVLTIVEGFNEVLNNTSIVLLVTVGERRLLLAGDAQVENWSYALDRARGENGREADPELLEALASVDLYKVGHHGSRNATPRRLVELWSGRPRGHEVCSVLSTRAGVYGTTAEGKVPKVELVNALKALGPVRSTDELPAGVWWLDVEAPATGKAVTWAFTEGPVQVKPRMRSQPGGGEEDADQPG